MPPSILSNTVIATSGRFLNVALGLVVIKLLTRFLGPTGFGFYALLISFGTLWQLLADFGLYLQLTRSLAEKPQQQKELINSIFSLRLVLLVVVFTVAAITATLIPSLENLRTPFLIIALGLIFQSLSQLYMGIFQYQQNVWQATFGDIVGRVSQIAVVVYLGVQSAALSGMALAFTISCGLALLVHQTALCRQAPRFTLTWSAWKELIRTSWPLGALLVLNAIYFRIDTLILSFFRSPAEVGWYSVAYRVVESVLFIPAMFGGLLLPRISEALAHGHNSTATQYISQGLTAMMVVAAFVTLTLLMKAPGIILFIADSSFLPAAPLLIILSLALACMFFGNIFGFAMIALKKQNALLKMYAALALANTAGNLLTIPTWGTSAAAVTTTLTEATATFVSAWIVWHYLPFRIPLQSLAGTLGALAAAAAVYYILPTTWPLLVTVALAAVAFGTVIMGSRALTRHQLSLLSNYPRP